MSFTQIVEVLTAVTMLGSAASEIPKVIDLREQAGLAAAARAAEVVADHVAALDNAETPKIDVPCPVVIMSQPGIEPIPFTCTLSEGILTIRHPSESGESPAGMPEIPSTLVMIPGATVKTGDGRFAAVSTLVTPQLAEKLFALITDINIPNPVRDIATEVLMSGTARLNGQPTIADLYLRDQAGNTHRVAFAPSNSAGILLLEVPDELSGLDPALIANDPRVLVLDGAGHQLGTLSAFLHELSLAGNAETAQAPDGLLTATQQIPDTLIALAPTSQESGSLSPYRGLIPTATPPAPPESIPLQVYDGPVVGQENEAQMLQLTIPQTPDSQAIIFTGATQADWDTLRQVINELQGSRSAREVRAAMEKLAASNTSPLVRWLYGLIGLVPPRDTVTIMGGEHPTTTNTAMSIQMPAIYYDKDGIVIVGWTSDNHPCAVTLGSNDLKNGALSRIFFGMTAIERDTHVPQPTDADIALLEALAASIADGKGEDGPQVALVDPTSRPDSSFDHDQAMAQLANTAHTVWVPVTFTMPGGAKETRTLPLPTGLTGKLGQASDGTWTLVVEESVRQIPSWYYAQYGRYGLSTGTLIIHVGAGHLYAIPEKPSWFSRTSSNETAFQGPTGQHASYFHPTAVPSAATVAAGVPLSDQVLKTKIIPAPIEVAVHRILDDLARELPRDSGQTWIAAQKARTHHSLHA